MGQGNLGGGRGRTGPAMLAQRANRMARLMPPINVGNIVTEEERQDKDPLLAALQKRFLLSAFPEKHRQVLRDYLEPRTT